MACRLNHAQSWTFPRQRRKRITKSRKNEIPKPVARLETTGPNRAIFRVFVVSCFRDSQFCRSSLDIGGSSPTMLRTVPVDHTYVSIPSFPDSLSPALFPWNMISWSGDQSIDRHFQSREEWAQRLFVMPPSCHRGLIERLADLDQACRLHRPLHLLKGEAPGVPVETRYRLLTVEA